jgi:hypothetical protein
VLLRALAPVGLKCTFRHRKSLLLIESTYLRQTVSINDTGRCGKRTCQLVLSQFAFLPRRHGDTEHLNCMAKPFSCGSCRFKFFSVTPW